MYEFNYEVYTINPKTKETGWDIKMVSVIAPNKEKAKEYLTKWELFDCVILFNFKIELKPEPNGLCALHPTQKACEGWLLEYDGYKRNNTPQLNPYKFIKEISV